MKGTWLCVGTQVPPLFFQKVFVTPNLNFLDPPCKSFINGPFFLDTVHSAPEFDPQLFLHNLCLMKHTILAVLCGSFAKYTQFVYLNTFVCDPWGAQVALSQSLSWYFKPQSSSGVSCFAAYPHEVAKCIFHGILQSKGTGCTPCAKKKKKALTFLEPALNPRPLLFTVCLIYDPVFQTFALSLETCMQCPNSITDFLKFAKSFEQKKKKHFC